MSDLLIDQVLARFRSPVPLPAQRVQAWAEALQAQDAQALLGSAAAGLADDEWLLVRQLPLVARWSENASEAEVGLQWQQAVQQALAQAVATGGDQVLRYRHRFDAMADLLYRSALGDGTRQWAWARMGLLPAASARAVLPPAQVLMAGVGALQREPAAVWPVLSRLIAAEADCAALGAVLRALPASAWGALLQSSRRTAPYTGALAGALAAGPAGGRDARTGVEEERREAARVAAGGLPALPPAGPAARLQAWARSRPELLASRGDALAALLAALAWPGPPPSLGEGARRRRTALGWLGVDEGARRATDRPPAARAPAQAAPAADAAALPAALPGLLAPAPRAADAPPLPALPEQRAAWQPTAWAGALFWLAQVPRSRLLASPGAPLPAVPPGLLHALVQALGVPDDDPAAAAFCGGELPAAGPAGPQHDDHAERAAAQVQHWGDWLDGAAPDLPPPRLATVCRRPGRLRIAPGWIELCLPLAAVQTPIRRLGLDLDPGWLPWWGSVLSIRYED